MNASKAYEQNLDGEYNIHYLSSFIIQNQGNLVETAILGNIDANKYEKDVST